MIRQGNHLKGVGAVIDKDFASCLLAQQLNADFLIILTAVEKVALRFGTPEETWLDDITVDEAKQYMEEGHFAPGSMLPKLSADVGIPTKLDAIKEEYERAPIWLESELFLCFVYCKNRGKMLKKVLSNNQSNNKLKNFYFLIIRVPVAPLTPSFAFCKRVMRAVRPLPDSANSTPA